MSAADRPRVVVTAAVVQRDGRFLLTRRLRGSHLEGCWEFPGGKCEPGESFEACLAREMEEELGTGVRVGQEIFTIEHAYPERVVELHFFECEITGEPTALLGQEMQWVRREELHALEFPPADAELLELLIRAG
jgi:8-oxo-dGTP diphosphatase